MYWVGNNIIVSHWNVLCSPFHFSVSENHSSLCMYGGWDIDSYTDLLRIPTKANNDFYTLDDVMANDQNLNGEHVNLFVVVRKAMFRFLSSY